MTTTPDPLSTGNPGAGPSPFDFGAEVYDRAFTWTLLGSLMRQAVWRRLDARFRPGDRILELNCGTGEDAIRMARRGIWVTATDASRAMLRQAEEKVSRAGEQSRIRMLPLRIEDLRFEDLHFEDLGSDGFPLPVPAPARGACVPLAGALSRSPHPIRTCPSCDCTDEGWPENALTEGGRFDGALSNFGGLNCVQDLAGAAPALAACLRPGAFALLCLMGPLCVWEWIWYGLKGRPGKAFRRLRPGGVEWRGVTIRYPAIGAVRRAFFPAFRLRRTTAIGALLPPPYTEDWASRRPGLIRRLNAWERRLETLRPLPCLADHYLLELERR